MFLCERNIDCLECQSRGMCNSYALFKYDDGYKDGYNKAIEDFVKFANTMPTVEADDGTIRPMWLEEMAERLKEKKNED